MRIKFNYDLSSMNTFRMKVSCACFVEYENVAELEGLNFDSLPRPLLHMGEGSNLLFTGDFPGTVLHSNIEYIKYVDVGLDEVPVIVGAGVNFDSFVAETCRHGLWGAENLSLIPGEVGAAAVQNIGAYGAEVKDIISGVVCFDLKERKKCRFKASECGYGYRSSMFKEGENRGRYVVTSVLFRLSRKPAPKLDYKGLREALGDRTDLTPRDLRDAVIEIRRSKLPDPEKTGSAGSFFKNPVVSAEQFARISPDGSAPHFVLPDGTVKVPAAWLIDSCGLKGTMEGGAQVYPAQPLVIVNASGEATPADVLALENRIVNEVKARFGVELHPEVEHI